MKIISRYVLKEHVGPLTFAFTALTSLMLLNFISRQLSQLVGKGLPWDVIGHFLLLSVPFVVALTIPMSVLVAVLYAFSRLAAENEVTAMKASGVSPWSLVAPALCGGLIMSLLLLAFNDQVLPRANHELKTLQEDISQTKPTLLLKEQVINSIAEGKFYLKAGKIDRTGDVGRLTEVVIYDLANPMRRRTIYADSGHIVFAANRVDLDLHLFHGQMQEIATDKPESLDRLFFRQDRIRIKDVGRDFKKSESDPMSKGDREMSICEMQQRLWVAETSYLGARRDFEDVNKPGHADAVSPPTGKAPEPRGIGWAYCKVIEKLFGVPEAHAADLRDYPQSAQQDTAKPPVQDTAKPKPAAAEPLQLDTGRTPVYSGEPPAPNSQGSAETLRKEQEAIAAAAAAALMRPATPALPPDVPIGGGLNSRQTEAKIRLELAQRSRDRYEIEIHKKFSLAAACLIFCIVAPPLALRFPRGGVGLVIGVSLPVFALYYVGLIGGEAAANKGYLDPFWAMWGTNVMLTLVGVVMLLRMGRDAGSARGGGIREWLDERRARREFRRTVARGAR